MLQLWDSLRAESKRFKIGTASALEILASGVPYLGDCKLIAMFSPSITPHDALVARDVK